VIAFLRHWRLSAPTRVKTIRTALVAARQTLNLLEQGLLIAAERNSDDVSTMKNQPVVPPSKT
jgi:hypothetical protein